MGLQATLTAEVERVVSAPYTVCLKVHIHAHLSARSLMHPLHTTGDD